MSDDAQRWKEKYLLSIEQQEKLERRWAARLDLLRRGLVRSTLAAEGTDRAVDQCMKEMRDVVRTDDMDAALTALLPRLEKAVLDSEQRRETRIDQMSTAPLRPQKAFWSNDLSEFLMYYDDVRTASNPEEALMEFLQSTYEAGANLAKWDRASLER